MTDAPRPTPRRRAPRPAADEHIDPVAGGSPAPTGPPPIDAASTHEYGAPRVSESGRKGSPEPTVQLNARVSVDAADIVEAAMRATGWTKRTVVEHALRTTYVATQGPQTHLETR
jgi:hypothetical protein